MVNNKMKKVLIIEDHLENCLMLVEFLSIYNYEIEFVTSTDEAFKLIDRYTPEVVLADWSVGGKKSIADVILRIREINYDVSVMFITGHSFDTLEKSLQSLEPFHFFLKPVDLDQLISTLNDI
jgi:DNA-binding NtrC family response regulator